MNSEVLALMIFEVRYVIYSYFGADMSYIGIGIGTEIAHGSQRVLELPELVLRLELLPQTNLTSLIL